MKESGIIKILKVSDPLVSGFFMAKMVENQRLGRGPGYFVFTMRSLETAGGFRAFLFIGRWYLQQNKMEESI